MEPINHIYSTLEVGNSHHGAISIFQKDTIEILSIEFNTTQTPSYIQKNKIKGTSELYE